MATKPDNEFFCSWGTFWTRLTGEKTQSLHWAVVLVFVLVFALLFEYIFHDYVQTSLEICIEVKSSRINLKNCRQAANYVFEIAKLQREYSYSFIRGTFWKRLTGEKTQSLHWAVVLAVVLVFVTVFGLLV